MLTAITSLPAGKQRPSMPNWIKLLLPWIWIAPALFLVGVFLLYPVLNTLWLSFLDANSIHFVGLQNFQQILTDNNMLLVLRNNLMWLVFGTAGTVALGLLIATLVDRVRIESVAKSAIFIPMAISFVGAGVIWKFIYQYNPPGTTQVGLLNAVTTHFGSQPQSWLTNTAFNNVALIVVYVWMWTGFCMVILSAALKGVPAEILEAARIDGANEISIFFRILVPMIRPTIAVVATTMIINLLKIFDIVYVMTGGNYNTDVVAFEYYNQNFLFQDSGRASALAIVLLIAIVPIMLFNIRQFRIQEAQR